MHTANAKGCFKISVTKNFTVRKKLSILDNPMLKKGTIFLGNIFFFNPTIWKPTAPAYQNKLPWINSLSILGVICIWTGSTGFHGTQKRQVYLLFFKEKHKNFMWKEKKTGEKKHKLHNWKAGHIQFFLAFGLGSRIRAIN